MKKIFILLAAFIVLGTSAQEQLTKKPDFTAIAKNIKAENSPYFYTTLFERYNRADTSMTIEERRHLYYGLAFTTVKTPERLAQTEEKLREILHQPNPTKKDYEDVITYTGVVLQAYPFSISVKKYREYCLKELGLYEMAAKEHAQSEILIDAMLSSGDGTTQDKSIYIIDLKNEYELIEVLGFTTPGDAYTAAGKYDYLVLDENAYQLEGLFFNTTGITITDTKTGVTDNTNF
ncbi:DUF4919 domain-containing protein [Flavobacterium rhizosphaerae]|uniref:DUF4919 domain-containing protein n=1 Tax=Flavobacterium rhizosphaerae TaxID=3163298 RepID=A0ABW8YWA6_9FLAO